MERAHHPDAPVSPHVETIHRLWDEIANSEREGDSALRHLLRVTGELVDARDAWWMGIVRTGEAESGDPLDGWRPRAMRFLNEEERQGYDFGDYVRLVTDGSVDESTIANVRRAGTFRVNWLPDLVSPEWFESDFFRMVYREYGIADAVFVGCPVNPDVEVILGYNRGDGHFSAADRALLGAALRPLRWFHRQTLLDHGLLVAREPLTPGERQVLQHLLTGLSERRIADSLGLAAPTVHNCITRVYRKFGVRSRASLMALWLGRSREI